MIKIGTVEKDGTAYGNKYYIQIEDTVGNDNRNLEKFVNKRVAVIIDDIKSIDDFISEIEKELL